jgi:ribulose-bisphosphate carboxylase large chain
MNKPIERRIDLSQRFKSGVLPYQRMGYWNPDYTWTASCWRCFASRRRTGSTPRRPSPPATATWTVVWTDRLTDYAHYRAKAYRLDPVPSIPGQYFA